jgi:hypothetical protein
VDLRSNLDTAIEKYGSGVLPQVALGSASVILGILFAPAAVLPVAAQAAIAARSSQIQRARVEKAQAQIGEQLEQIDEEKVDSAFVESEGFYDWLYEAFDRISRAQDKAKFDALRNVFVNGLLVGQSAGPVRDIVLRSVGELSPHHVRAVRVVQHASHARNFIGSTEEAGVSYADRPDVRAQMADLTDFEFESLIRDLDRLDIIGPPFPAGSIGAMDPVSDAIALTELGRMMVTYMTDPTSG